jgi:polyhydroxyalkanoate synthesis regulator phasin
MPQPKKSGPKSRSKSASKPKPKAKAAPKAAAGRKRGAASGGRASSRKPPAQTASPPPVDDKHDDAIHATVAAVRELLSRGVMITGDRLQETMDEAVKRGRMTRTDAEELVQVLIQIGRRQTQDALAELEGLVERSAEETRKRTRTRVRDVAKAARRAPGTDRALRTVDRVRRTAGLGSSFPIIGYDELTAAQVKDRLTDLSAPELRKVRDYERRNANRKSVLGAIEKKLG